jgi:hypothetical protein
MFAAGILIASVAFLPIRERVEEQEKATSHEGDSESLLIGNGDEQADKP